MNPMSTGTDEVAINISKAVISLGTTIYKNKVILNENMNPIIMFMRAIEKYS
jgi:hypothetical protein